MQGCSWNSFQFSNATQMGHNDNIQTPDNDFIGLGCVARWLTTSPSWNSHSEPGAMGPNPHCR